MTPPLFGLTETHPWAFAITRLGKTVENRTWHPHKHGGCVGMYLAIHGGKIQPSGEKREAAMKQSAGLHHDLARRRTTETDLSEDQGDWLRRRWLPAGQAEPTLLDYWTPGIVALARVARVVWWTEDRAPTWWAASGQYHWHLVDVTPLAAPIPYVGAQYLWRIDADTTDRLRAAWAEQHDGLVMF